MGGRSVPRNRRGQAEPWFGPVLHPARDCSHGDQRDRRCGKHGRHGGDASAFRGRVAVAAVGTTDRLLGSGPLVLAAVMNRRSLRRYVRRGHGTIRMRG